VIVDFEGRRGGDGDEEEDNGKDDLVRMMEDGRWILATAAKIFVYVSDEKDTSGRAEPQHTTCQGGRLCTTSSP
jgi:hypothetical protein